MSMNMPLKNILMLVEAASLHQMSGEFMITSLGFFCNLDYLKELRFRCIHISSILLSCDSYWLP